MNKRQEAFTRIFQGNEWQSNESRSGHGSAYAYTARIREVLPRLLKSFDIKTLLDAPCGDFNWMRHVNVDSTKYIGCDIVEDIVRNNQTKYPNAEFHCLDLAEDTLPVADMVFSRDCLQHLPEQDIWKVLRNFKRTKARWLFTSSHSTASQEIAVDAGGFGQLNLQLAPFHFPLPIFIMPEEHYVTKAMCLWNMNEIPNND